MLQRPVTAGTSAVLGRTMAGGLCLFLLGASLAGLLLPGASGKCPSPCRLQGWPWGGGG